MSRNYNHRFRWRL